MEDDTQKINDLVSTEEQQEESLNYFELAKKIARAEGILSKEEIKKVFLVDDECQ